MIWYALRTAPQKEYTAQMLLDRRGIRTFLPVETKWKRVSRHKKEPISCPSYPRYLFVGAEKQFPWHDVLRMKGLPVTGVVTVNGLPAPIAPSAIEKLAKLSGNCFRTRETRVNKSFVPGDMVRVPETYFEDWSIPLISIKGKMADVLIDMLGEKRVVQVPVDRLEAA